MDETIEPPRTWGRFTVATACPLDCPDSCSLAVTVERGRLTKIVGSTVAPTTRGRICGKVRRFGDRVYGSDRLLHPAMRTGPKGSGEFGRITWDEALDLIALKLQEARAHSGAESVLPYGSGRSNGLLTHDLEDARLFRRFGAARLSPATDAPLDTACAAMYGEMPGVAYEDFAQAKLIVVWGANPSASGVHLIAHIKRAQRAGARLVVIDPRRTPLAKRADLHLAVRPGTDLPVALAVIRTLFEQGWADETFLSTHASGAAALRAAADAWPIDRAAAEADVSAADLSAFAEWYGTTSPAVIRCGAGQAHTRHGASSTLAILALPAVGGKFGVPGGGYSISTASAWNISTEALIGTPAPASRIVNRHQLGRALTDASTPISVLFVYNANPLATAPDQDRIRRGLAREDLFTVVYDQVKTDTADFADVILPATTFLEHYDIARGRGVYHLHLVQPAIEALGESRPNPEVFRDLGVRLGLAADDGLGEAGALMETIGRLPERIQSALVAESPGVAPAVADGRPVQFVDVRPGTPDRRVHLYPPAVDGDHPYVYEAIPATDDFPLSLIRPESPRTIASTMAELRPAIARVRIHPDDAHPRAIADGDTVRVFNALGDVHCDATITPEIRPGTISLPEGLWGKSTYNGSTPNVLVADTVTAVGSACGNDARVQIELLARH